MHFKNLDVPFLTLKGDYASVAILIFEKKDILFIKRSDHLPTHKGHIAFPGGKKDNSDLNIVETALREVEEELFINKSTITPIGKLNSVDTVEYKFEVFPIVCEGEHRPESYNPDEVQGVFYLNILDLKNAKNWKYRGNYENDWIYLFENEILWGATAYMTRELLEIELG